MTALRADNVYPLRMEEAIGLDGQADVPPTASTIAAALAEIDADVPAKPKKPRKKKSATGRKRGRPPTAKAKTIKPDDGDITPETKPEPKIAPSGEGVWPRIRRIKADQWVWILIPVAAVALAVSLAFLTGAVKL